MSKFLNKPIAGNDAIEWALQNGNTTKTGNISGGLGLNIIFEFVKHNNGKIQLISADGYWEWKNGIVISQIFPYSFHGTIANIRFNLNDKSHYIMRSEQKDLHNIF